MTIIAQIQGGLGNQLFQYAFGRAMSVARQAELVLDSRWFELSHHEVTPRPYLLPYLCIKAQAKVYPKIIQRPNRVRRIAQNILLLSPFILSERTDYVYDASVFAKRPFAAQDWYVQGYWQSYKYFEHIYQKLSVELNINFPLDWHYEQYFEKIAHGNSTMVHVRRGDYVTLPSAAKVHGGVIDASYYERTMRWLLGREPSTHFFVFSDDQNWAQANLPYAQNCTFVTSLNQPNAVVQELMLMRACRHHIIANSSLSWWGAWLAHNPDAPLGLVACPKRWINRDHHADDLLPPTWHRF